MAKATDEQLRPVLEALQRRFGPQGLRRLGEIPLRPALAPIPTGFAALDAALGVGGIPRGHVTELIGAPTSGMATLALKVVANAQAAGDVAAFVDLAHTFDPAYAARCGVNVADLLLVHGPARDRALDVAHDLVASRVVGLIVFHVIRALPSQDGAVTTGLRRLQRALDGSGCALIFLAPEGAGGSSLHFNGSASAGLAHFASLRLRLRREAWLEDGDDVRGYRVRVRVELSKFGLEGREVPIEITFDDVVDGDGA